MNPWVLLLLLASPQDFKEELPRLPPTEPADAPKTFRLQPGYRLELVAAEPLVASPVDLAFDEEGRLWVVEMIDYPFNETEGNPPQGRLVRLESRHRDGRFDSRVVIADKLPCPTGLALWDGGAFVTAAPYLLYLKEGVRKVIQDGFGTQNIQGLANNIKFGLDNWFTGSGGSNGGQIIPAAVGINGRDFRFRPGGEFEPLSGGGQFGSSFDDFGRRFVCSNANSARHVVLDDAVLRHNPYYAVTAVTASIAAEGDAGTVYRTSPQEPWRVLRTRLRKEGQIRGQVEGVTNFTSATGIFFHQGRLYVGEVAHNLISRKRLTPDGSTFRAERIDRDSEFLTSTDNWFRPVNFATGPDGALYVCDMYREVIEHPHSLPDSIKKYLDLTSGKDRGRVWRIIDEKAPPWSTPNLRTKDDLVEALKKDAWHRQTAARLIFQRQDPSLVPLLEKLLADDRPETRAAALWALDGLGVRRGEALLRDPSADVREQAVRLSAVESLYDDTDESPRVRLWLACRMAESTDPRAKAAVERLKPGADRWLQTAIAIASGEKTAVKRIQESKAPAPVQALGDRKKVVESYREVLDLKGDPARGLEVYRKNCIGCHRAGKEGKDVGPDLVTVKQRTPEELLIAILDPSREVNPQYVAVRIKTTSDQVLDGLIASETATSVTLKRQEGLVDTILKVNIDRMVRSTLSLMPDGFEKAVDPQAMADLIQFLRQ
ncbi:MAG TPA: PVC-type heme-binding CxxCH protein [Planctomycetota bacterium]|nr:PVC-type heme-binding CxxCH protein [Planctomycetota bacterium]